MDLDQAVEKNPHLKEYMDSFVGSGGVRPMFSGSLTEEMSVLKRVNLIYPVGDPIFIHVHDDEKGRHYSVIEPHLTDEEEEKLEKIRDHIRKQIDLLERYEAVDGGWGYYDFNVGSQKPTAIS
ncbi:MAG: hypothetical protein ACMUHY_03475, partial [Thermoplasmatota archaeon]